MPVRKRCWDTVIGFKTQILCNNDSIEKRKKVQTDIDMHLEGCEDAYVDGKLTRQIKPENIQYKIQTGSVTQIRCARRRLPRKCRMVEIQRDRIEVCTDDPLSKKVDVLDVIDSVLIGCSEGKFENADGSKFNMYQPRMGLDAVDRNYIGRQVILGEVTSVKCSKRIKKRPKKENK